MKHFVINFNTSLTAKQYERFSNILDNAGQVFLGVAVLSPLISGFDKMNWLVVLSGIVVVGTCWIGSILILRKGKKK
jgi:TM2 domain-containing membrane protein YozV